MSNSTFSNNEATEDGGAIYNNQSINLLASTLYQNKAINLGPNIYISATGSMALRQNIIAGETMDFYVEVPQSMSSEGNNLIGNGEGFGNWQSSDLVGSSDEIMDPLLKPLTDNGGPTWTHALRTSSPAIDAGSLLFLLPSDLLEDQRGYTRLTSPQDSLSDIGAFERHPIQISSESFSFCVDTNSTNLTDYFSLNDITISDPAGGALGVGDSLFLVFALSDGFEFREGFGSVRFIGNEVQGAPNPISINRDTLIINYDRFFTASVDSIIISDLEVRANTENSTQGALTLVNIGSKTSRTTNIDRDSIPIASFFRLPIIAGDIALQDFNEDNGDWFPRGDNNLWEWKDPDGSFEGAESKAWTTQADGGKYGPNNISILLSGCFDLSNLTNPFVELDIWSDALDNFDGTVLQYTPAGEEDWKTIGSASSGVGWYDDIRVLSNPGIPGTNTTAFAYGWTGRDTAWVEAKHPLPPLTESEKRNVRFRMVFASGSAVHPDQTNNGFAFDNFFIGDQEIKLLFEQFTNLDRVANSNEILSTNAEALIPIRYFVSKGESFYNVNPVGPRTRSLYYGVSEPGISVISGIDYSGPTDSIRQLFLDRSKLRGSIMEIEINASNNDAPVRIEAKSSFPDQELVVYMALVENGVNSNYDFVFRQFVPDAAGTSYWNWSAGEQKTFDLSWFENQTSIRLNEYNTDSLHLVVFVQNQQTKEVYQAASAKVWPELVAALERREAGQSIEPTFSLYPNPASDYLTLQTGTSPEKPFSVVFYNLQGAIVKTLQLAGETNEHKLEISELASGWYYVRVGTGADIWLQKRIAVIR